MPSIKMELKFPLYEIQLDIIFSPRSITKSIFLLKTSILENDESLHPAAITAACCTWAFFKSPFQKINFRLFFSLIKCCNNSLLIQSLTVETKCTSFILFFLKEKIQKNKRKGTFHIKKFPSFLIPLQQIWPANLLCIGQVPSMNDQKVCF